MPLPEDAKRLADQARKQEEANKLARRNSVLSGLGKVKNKSVGKLRAALAAGIKT